MNKKLSKGNFKAKEARILQPNFWLTCNRNAETSAHIFHYKPYKTDQQRQQKGMVVEETVAEGHLVDRTIV